MLLAALLLALALQPPIPIGAQESAVAAPREDVDALQAEFASAVEAHRQEVRAAASLEERRKLRADEPAAHFWPRFRALADAGEGRALLWMLRNVDDASLPAAEVDATRPALAKRLCEGFVDERWFPEALEAIAKERRKLGLPFLETELSAASERARSPEGRAAPLAALAHALLRSKDEAEHARGATLLERVATQFAETRAGRAAADELFVEKNLAIGALAPDFQGKTIDGKAFALSDYRGKVVVLDFFGFW